MAWLLETSDEIEDAVKGITEATDEAPVERAGRLSPCTATAHRTLGPLFTGSTKKWAFNFNWGVV